MRRAKPETREILPDIRFNSVNVQTMVQHVLKKGKKSTALRLIYTALDLIKERTEKNPLDVFEQAMKNVQPQMETRSRRVGGANYQIPFEVKGQRQNHLTMMWFVAACRGRKGMSMEDRIAHELVDAFNNTGTAVKKREDTHKMADANRAFAHFAR